MITNDRKSNLNMLDKAKKNPYNFCIEQILYGGFFMFQNCKDSISKVILPVKQKNDKETVGEFKKRKIMAQKLPPRYVEIGKIYDDERFLKWAYNVENCGTYLEFYNWEKAGLKVKSANFCKDRLCPMCNWRRSLRMFAKLSKIIQSEHYIKTGYVNLFLTLTVKNVKPGDLHTGIAHLFYSFKKFVQHKAIKSAVKGYFRALEITYNKERKDFHHHLHCILAVPGSYFSTSYLSQAKLSHIWKQSLADDINYIDSPPVLDIRKFRDSKGIAEASKYVIKSDDKFLKNISNEALRILRLELGGTRLVGFGGVFRKIARALKLEISDDLVENEIPENDILLEILTLKWSIGLKNYELFQTEKVGF